MEAMVNSSIGAPGLVRVSPAPECPDPAFLPNIQPNSPIFQVALADAIQAPPPTPGLLRPDNPDPIT